MRSGLAIEMRIWSKLCGPETCPKMFINSFIEDPSRAQSSCPRKRASRAAGTASLILDPRFRGGDGSQILHSCLYLRRSSVAALLQLDVEAKRAQFLDEDI